MELSIDEILERLNNDSSINFLGIAVTVQHANGIDACIH